MQKALRAEVLHAGSDVHHEAQKTLVRDKLEESQDTFFKIKCVKCAFFLLKGALGTV